MSSMMSSRKVERELRTLLNQIQRIAPSDASVLIRGGTDSIRKAFASKIHALSSRRNAPFVALDCGSRNHAELECQLFGTESEIDDTKDSNNHGLIIAADGGTLFLDTIEASRGKLQLRLNRLLEQRWCYERKGIGPVSVNVRLIVGTACDLEELVLAGKFLDNLLYSISADTLRIPLPRERQEEVVQTVERLLQSPPQ
jgi:DNA-binding NtrC family response regulator